jgi:hypothetical protein
VPALFRHLQIRDQRDNERPVIASGIEAKRARR